MSFQDWVLFRMEERDLSEERLASYIGCSVESIRSVTRDGHEPTGGFLSKICTALGFTLPWGGA